MGEGDGWAQRLAGHPFILVVGILASFATLILAVPTALGTLDADDNQPAAIESETTTSIVATTTSAPVATVVTPNWGDYTDLGNSEVSPQPCLGLLGSCVGHSADSVLERMGPPSDGSPLIFETDGEGVIKEYLWLLDGVGELEVRVSSVDTVDTIRLSTTETSNAAVALPNDGLLDVGADSMLTASEQVTTTLGFEPSSVVASALGNELVIQATWALGPGQNEELVLIGSLETSPAALDALCVPASRLPEGVVMWFEEAQELLSMASLLSVTPSLFSSQEVGPSDC